MSHSGHACTQCGRSFSSLTRFDEHQAVDYSRTPHVQCLNPRDLGMVHHRTWVGLHGRPVWTRPYDPDNDPRTTTEDTP